MEKFKIPQDLIEKLNNIKAIANEIEEEYNNTREKVSQLDRLKTDLYHDVEEAKNLTIDEKVKAYDEFESCVNLRRYYKERLAYLDSIRGNLTLEGIEQAIEGVNNVTKRIETKNWEHKINDELREELLNESRKLL